MIKLKITDYTVPLPKDWLKDLSLLSETDLVTIESGKYQIDNDDIFAIVQEYDTKEEKDCVLEGHHKYIDIQYVIQGVEFMGFTPLINQVSVEENLEKDYTFYKGDTSID